MASKESRAKARAEGRTTCEWCGNDLTEHQIKIGSRFCTKSCSAKWRVKNKPKAVWSDESRASMSRKLRDFYKSEAGEKYRSELSRRMSENNPSLIDGVTEKANRTKRKNGTYRNNFKYGNGHISPSESAAMRALDGLGFEYNASIKTPRDYVDENHEPVPRSYKPDFVNRECMLCVEIDGPNHKRPHIAAKDAKKERCLIYMGYRIIRFTNEYVLNNPDEFRDSVVHYMNGGSNEG